MNGIHPNRNSRFLLRPRSLYLLPAIMMVLGSAGCATPEPVVRYEETAWEFGNRNGASFATEHFDLYTTVADKAWRGALSAFLEDCHHRYRTLIPNAAWADRRVETYVFETRDEWERFTRRRFPTRSGTYEMIRAGGYSEGTIAVCYLLADRGQTLAVLAHEGMHQFLAAGGQQGIPPWLNEGLSTYCERPVTAKSSALSEPNIYRINDLRTAVAADQLIPLADLLATDAGSILLQRDSQLTRTYYAQSYALIDYLRQGPDPKRRKAFEAMMRDLAAGNLENRARAEMIGATDDPSRSLGHALFRYYIGEDIEGIDAGYREHCRTLTGLRSVGHVGR